MQAKDVMTTQVVSVSDSSSVYDVALTLLDCGIIAAPVLDATGRLIGIVSEGDLMHRAEPAPGASALGGCQCSRTPRRWRRIL